MQNDVLATGIMSFVMHEVVYFGRSLPWIIIDAIPYFRKWKIQNVGNLNTPHLLPTPNLSKLDFTDNTKKKNRPRFQLRQSNGVAHILSYFLISPSSFLKSGTKSN